MTDTNERADWRTMDAGREMDRIVAERLGWTEIEEQENWYEDPEVMAYQQIDLYGRKDGSEYRVPKYSTDANAALQLDKPVLWWSEDDGRWLATYDAAIFGSAIELDVSPSPGEADTPALAICRAWLSWKDAQS